MLSRAKQIAEISALLHGLAGQNVWIEKKADEPMWEKATLIKKRERGRERGGGAHNFSSSDSLGQWPVWVAGMHLLEPSSVLPRMMAS